MRAASTWSPWAARRAKDEIDKPWSPSRRHLPMCRAERPFFVFAPNGAPLSSSKSTTWSCPERAAQCNGAREDQHPSSSISKSVTVGSYWVRLWSSRRSARPSPITIEQCSLYPISMQREVVWCFARSEEINRLDRVCFWRVLSISSSLAAEQYLCVHRTAIELLPTDHCLVSREEERWCHL